MNIDGLSLRPLVGELDARLAGARIERIFQPDKTTLLLWLRQPGENIPLAVCANPQRAGVYAPAAAPENPPVPPTFCMLLRKHLEDGRIAKIEQQGLDRAVAISADVRGERGLIVTKQLIIEIMGKHSNIILAQDGIIIDSIRRVGVNISRLRQVLPGREYLPPPGNPRLNPLGADAGDFIALVRRSQPGATLEKAIIATAEGIGPLTAREIAWRAGLSPSLAVNDLDDADAASLTEAAAALLEPLGAGQASPSVVLAGDGGRLLGVAAFPLEHLAGGQALSFPTMSAALEFTFNFTARQENPEKTALAKLVAAESARLNRKEEVLTRELEDAAGADTPRQYGDILMASFHTVPAGAAEARLPNLYAADPEEEIVIPLSPLHSALENAQRYYGKYNKLKRAQESLAVQLRECRREIAYLDSIGVALDHAATYEEAAEIRQELCQAGYIKDKAKRRSAPSSAPLAAATPDGLPLLIGKNNRQNDLVTFKQAHPDDIWLHTKDIPGSHVILRAAGREPSPEALAAAAAVAAYYSKARLSSNVPVDYTRRRHVKKPPGAKPGFVTYDHQKTLFVTPDEQLVQKLLTAKKGQG